MSTIALGAGHHTLRGFLAQPRSVVTADLVLLVASVALVVMDLLQLDFADYPADASTFAAAMALLVLAGALSLGIPRQRGNGRLMLAISAIASAADLSLGAIGVGPFAFLADVLPYFSNACVGHLLLRWPGPGLQNRAQRVTIVLAYTVLPGSIVLSDCFYTARDVWQVGTAVWWPTIVDDKFVGFVIYRTGVALFAALITTFVVLIVLRVVRAPRPARVELIPVVLAIGLVVVDGVLEIAADAGARLDDNLVQNLALDVIPIAFLVSVGVRRVQRALAIEALSTRAGSADVADVVRELRRAMGDRRLDVAVYATESGRYVAADDTDAPVVALGRRALFVAADDGSPLARLDVAAALADRSELSGPIARVAVSALESARLRAELRARQADQDAARARIDDLAAEGERLSRMLPGGLPEKLRADPGALGRIDESVVTVVMSDVRGYTGISERTPPGQLARQLREHRAAMNAAILAEGGTVMQYVGDAVMAVFGAPFAQADHAARAVRAARAMHAGQHAVNGTWHEAGWPAFHLGIGVSTGPVATAVLGSEERYEYTIVGDTVNLAQRLESEARPGGTTIVSAATAESAGLALEGEALPPLPVKGRAAPVGAFRIRELSQPFG